MTGTKPTDLNVLSPTPPPEARYRRKDAVDMDTLLKELAGYYVNELYSDSEREWDHQYIMDHTERFLDGDTPLERLRKENFGIYPDRRGGELKVEGEDLVATYERLHGDDIEEEWVAALSYDEEAPVPRENDKDAAIMRHLKEEFTV